MYFSWQKRRIITKLAVWAAREGAARQYLYTLADAVGERVASDELEGPGEPGGVGILRNDEPVDIEEEDRRFSMYFCHPSGDAGEFAGHPVDYKLLAPTAPVEGNLAFQTAVEGTSGVIFVAEANNERANADALDVLADRLLATPKIDATESKLEAAFGNEQAPQLRILLPPHGSDTPDPTAFRRRHGLPERVDIEPAHPWNADEAWQHFLALADSLEPAFRRAHDQGLIPEAR